MSQTDLSGKITYVSQAFCEVSGYSKEELLGQPHNLVRHPDMPSEFFKELWSTIQSNQVFKGDVKNLRKDGSFYWVESTISPHVDAQSNKIDGYMSVRIDITDKKRVEELSITDPLTSSYNRRHFNTIFSKLLNGAKRDKNSLYFIMIDVDHFKEYNDTYGHKKGDDALIAISKVIQENLHRSTDYFFRLGGEEFGIIYESHSNEQCLEHAQMLCQAVESLHISHVKNSASDFLTVSMGLVCIDYLDESTFDSIYMHADSLLYKAKENGRNRVEVDKKGMCFYEKS